MDLIDTYSTTTTSSDADDSELGAREVRKVYLVTYSQANTKKFPT